MRLLLASIATALALGAGQLDSPSIGYMRTAAGDIVRVNGIAGAFVTEASSQAGTVYAAFSARLSIIKLDAAIRILDANGAVLNESDAPDGAAVAGFNAGADASIVYYPANQSVAVFASGGWRAVPFDAHGDKVLAVTLPDAGRGLVVVAGEQLSLVRFRLTDGAIEDSQTLSDLPPDLDSVLLFPDGNLLFRRGDSVILRDAAGGEQSIPGVSEIVTWVHMGEGWVHGRTASGRNVGVRIGTAFRLYELPEVSR